MAARRLTKQLIMKTLVTFSVFVLLTGTSCYYDKFENFKPATVCDTSSVVKYTVDVKAILDANCNSCHGGSGASGAGIVLDNYTAVKNVAASGKLLSSVNWDGNASRMPKGAFDKIDPCSIHKLKKWISNNYAQ